MAWIDYKKAYGIPMDIRRPLDIQWTSMPSPDFI